MNGTAPPTRVPSEAGARVNGTTPPTRVPSEAGRVMNGSGAVALVGTCRVTHLLNNRVGRHRGCKERGRGGEGRGGERDKIVEPVMLASCNF